jgi:hypothetical protein
VTSTTSQAPPDYVRVPWSSLDPALNEKGYYVGRVERSLYWITDGDYTCAFLATRDGVALFNAPPTIGQNIQPAVDEIAASVSGSARYKASPGKSAAAMAGVLPSTKMPDPGAA